MTPDLFLGLALGLVVGAGLDSFAKWLERRFHREATREVTEHLALQRQRTERRRSELADAATLAAEQGKPRSVVRAMERRRHDRERQG